MVKMRKLYGYVVCAILVCAPAGIAEAASVGEPAPNFSLLDLNGKTHIPAEYRGSVLVLYFLGYN